MASINTTVAIPRVFNVTELTSGKNLTKPSTKPKQARRIGTITTEFNKIITSDDLIVDKSDYIKTLWRKKLFLKFASIYVPEKSI